MRFQGWKIDRFGVLRNHAVSDLPPGLVLFQGPNESGKSTLLGFLRCMLFGFANLRGNRRRKNLFPPLGEGRHGGQLHLQTRDGRVTVDREVGKSRPQVILADGTRGTAQDLARLLDPVDRAVHETVFAFSLDELALLKTPGAKGIQDRIFEASIGETGKRSRAWLDELQTEANRILDENGPGPELAALLAQREELAERLQVLEKEAARYRDLRMERAACLGAREALAREQEIFRGKEQIAATLIELWDLWEPALERKALLEELEPIDTFVSEPEERLEQCRNNMQTALEAVAALEAEAAVCKEELVALEERFDETCFNLAPEVMAWDPVSLFNDRLELQTACQDHRADLQREVDRLRKPLGEAWSDDRIGAFETGEEIEQEAGAWTERLDQADQRIEQARDEAAQSERIRTEAEKEQQAARDEVFNGVRDRASALDQREERLVRREQSCRDAGDRYQRLIDREAELQAAWDALGTPFYWLWAALTAVGSVCFFETALVRALTGDLVSGTIACCAGLIYGCYAWTFRRRHQAFRERETASRQLEAEVVDLRHAWLNAQGVTAPAGQDEQNVERDDPAAEEALSLADKQVQAARIDVDRCIEQVCEAKKTRELLGTSWREWLGSQGFEERGSPSGLLEDLRSIERIQDYLHEMERIVSREERLAAEIRDWEERTGDLLERAGRSTEPRSLGAEMAQAFQRLHDDCVEEIDRREKARTLTARIAEIASETEKAQAGLQEAESALNGLLREVDAGSESEFLERLEIYKKRQQLKAQVREIEETVTDRLAHVADADSIRDELDRGGIEEWRIAQDEARARSEELASARDELSGDLRELEKTVSALETSDELQTTQLQCACLDQAIEKIVSRWQGLQVRHRLLGNALERYLRENQPAVLKEAGRLLGKATQGRYPEVRLDEEGMGLVVRTARGEEKQLDALSLGTAELLYLCMRFALVRSFTGHGFSLPVIMDDVLVNFDPRRAQAVAAMVHEISRENQVLLFTCHPTTVELFQQIDSAVHVESMPSRDRITVQ